MCLGRWMGKLVRRTASEHVRLNRDHCRIGPAVELRVQVSFSPLGLSKKLKDVLHESFVFTSSTFTFLMDVSHESFVSTSSTFTFLMDVSHESFVFTSSTFTFSGKSCTKCVLELQFLLCFATRSADCIVVAASRFLGAAAMCVVLLSFAARHRKPYLSGCIKAAIMICQQIFLILALLIFLFKVPFKKCSKIVYHPSFH